MDLDPAWIAAQMDRLANTHNADQDSRAKRGEISASTARARRLTGWDLHRLWLSVGMLALPASPTASLPGLEHVNPPRATDATIRAKADVSQHVAMQGLAVLDGAGWITRRFNGRGHTYEQCVPREALGNGPIPVASRTFERPPAMVM